MKEKIKKFSVFIIIPLLFVSFVQSAILLFIPSQTAYAALADSESEQKNRREAVALKYCIDNAGFAPIIYDNFGGHISDFDLFNPWDFTWQGIRRGDVAPIGSDMGKNDDGSVNCSDLDGAKSYLGFDFQTLWDKRDAPCDPANLYFAACWILNNGKVEEVKNKLNDFINARLPLPEEEMKRRVRYHLLEICAEPAEAINDPRYFVVDGQNYRYKDGKDAGSEILFGMDYDFDGPIDGIVKCGGLVLEANKIHALTDASGNPIPPGGGDSGGGGGETAIECNMISWNALKWFLCPLIKIGETAVNALDNLITYMLKFPTDKYFTDNGSLQKAWGNMRNLALGILIIAGLVMVISQAIGTGPFDAYTIKKVMPRIVFAVIFISLSFEILKFLVEFSNIAGLGVRSLIEGAFNLSGSGQVSFSNGALAIGNGAIVGVGLSLGFMGILSLMATALLGVLLAFLVLAARQMVIIMLVIVAPIAIACYILPNTEKVWKMWWDFFIRAIFAFPIITAFIASGRAFAQVSTQGPPGDAFTNTLTSILAFIAYFGPYFALPYAFKLAGGAVAQIGGVVNDRSRGAFDRMKNYRGRKMKENSEAMKYGNRFEGKSWIPLSRTASKAFNRSTVGLGTGFKGGFGFGERGRQAIDQKRRLGASESVMKSAAFQGIQFNDDALLAATYGNASEATAKLTAEFGGDEDRARRAVSAVQASIGFGRPQAIAAAQAASTTGTAFNSLEHQVETIARAGGGNASTTSALAGFMNSENKRVGRNDLAPGYAKLNELAQKTAGIQAGAVGANDIREAKQAAWNSGSLYTHANAKPQDIKAAVEHFAGELQSGDAARQENAAVFFNELKSMQPSASGEVRNVIDAALDPNNPANYAGQVESIMASLPDTPSHPSTDKTLTQEVQVLDPATGNYTTTRQVTGTRAENAKERILRRSRAYERPDPNVI